MIQFFEAILYVTSALMVAGISFLIVTGIWLAFCKFAEKRDWWGML